MASRDGSAGVELEAVATDLRDRAGVDDLGTVTTDDELLDRAVTTTLNRPALRQRREIAVEPMAIGIQTCITRMIRACPPRVPGRRIRGALQRSGDCFVRS
jgi:hypothetical protein